MKKNLLLMAMALCCTLWLRADNLKTIAKLYDYCPAPGQHVNNVPEWEDGDTKETFMASVEETLKDGGLISLGGFGGYIVFGFDHPVVNVSGEYDFKVYGNASADLQYSGYCSSEPGIVMVSVDTNGNGLPDDEWYELAGSDYSLSSTLKKVKITYYKPDANRDVNADPDPVNTYITDRTYIKWQINDDEDNTGYIMRNTFHSQSYWPNWIDDETLTFEGTMLESNIEDKSGNGTYYVAKSRDWGYVDDQPNSEALGFNIDWAVDADGNKVKLDKIDFVKVYTAVNDYAGWMGEISTEVRGAEDLHPSASVGNIEADEHISIVGTEGAIRVAGARSVAVFTLGGALVAQMSGDGEVALTPALYVVRADSRSVLVQVK